MATIDLWQDFVRVPSDESFRPLYEATKRLVWTLAIRILRDPNDATDAFQGAYSRLVALARDERSAAAIVDDDDLARLVARATVREADRIRKRRARRKARERLVGASGAMDHEGRSSRLGRRGGESPIEASAASEIREKVERIVSDLPERYRLPILLHYFDGLPLRKVAEALDVPLATLAHRHRRALERLEMPLRHAGLDGTRALATIALGALLIEPRISAASVFTAANAAASVGPALTSALASTTTSTSGRALGPYLLMTSVSTQAKALVAVLVILALITGGLIYQNRSGRETEERESVEAARETNAMAAPGTTGGDPATDTAVVAETDANAADAAERATLTVTVTWSESGDPVSGAEILVQTENETLLARGTTDDAGRAKIAIDGESGGDPNREAGSNGERDDTAALTPERRAIRVTAKHRESADETLEMDMEPDRAIAITLARDVLVGVVTDAVTGEAIEDARVRIDEFGGTLAETTTGPDGFYSIARPKAGELHVIASAPAHATKSMRLEHISPRVSVGDFALDAGATVIARVTDEEGRPLAGVRVTPSHAGMDGAFYTDYGVDTDERGEARIENVSRAKPPKMQIAKEGFVSAYVRPELDPRADSSELRVALRRIETSTRAITGRITDEKGRPIEGARVEWKDGQGTRFSDDEPYGEVHAISDRRGVYRLEFEDDYPTCHLGVGAPGRAPLVRRGVRPGTPDAPLELDFVLEPGHWLEGTIVGEKGEPLEGIEIRAMPSRSLLNEGVAYPVVHREARTGPHGRFRLDDLAGGTVALLIFGSGRPHREEEVEVDQEVEIALPGFGSIRGRVVDGESGDPITSFTVRIRSAPRGIAVDLARVGRTFNSPEGRFEIGQRDPSGPHEIEILADGFPPTSFKDVVPLTKESDEEPVFALERGRVLEGIVVDGESGAPLEGIRVQASASEHAASIIPRDWDPFRQVLGARDTLTDRDGRFTFDETEPLHILVRAKGRQSFYLAPDDRARYTIPQGLLLVPLSRGEILEGVVLGPERPLAGVEVKIARRTESGRKGDAAFEIHGSATSDADGRIAFHDLAPGEHRLTTKRRPEKPDDRFEVEFRTFVDIVSGERASVELPVDRGSITLEGAVEGMDETESLFVEVTLRPVDDEGVAREIFFKTYKDWSFRYHCPDLAPGRYKVLANYWAEGGERTVELAPIELREGASASTASIDIATAQAPEATR